MDGIDFSVSFNGARKYYSVPELDWEGIKLEPSGIIHTGPQSFLDIQLIPSGTVIKVSENSSLIYNGVDETGNFQDFGLLYGRIRVVTWNEVNPLVIRGGGVSVKLEKGDYSLDYLLEQIEPNSAPKPIFSIFSIKGKLEVFPYGMGASSPYFGGVNVVSLDDAEGLSLDITSFHTLLEKKYISRDILQYWDNNRFFTPFLIPGPETQITFYPFVTQITGSIPAATSTSSTPLPSIRVVRPETEIRSTNVFLGLGLALTATAVATQFLANPWYEIIPNRNIAKNLYNLSYIPMGFGLTSIIVGIINHPSR